MHWGTAGSTRSMYCMIENRGSAGSIVSASWRMIMSTRSNPRIRHVKVRSRVCSSLIFFD